MTSWLALLVALLALAALPFVAEAMRRPADPGKAPGQIAYLPSGATHYRWHGPESGPVALCVHGLTTPSFVFDPLANLLAQRGIRVLTYDLPGRGFSEPVQEPQDSELFCRQISELLAHQGLARVDLLIGYSMGGAIATRFAATAPDQCARLVMLAGSGLLYTPGTLAQLVTRVPLLGDWLFLTLGGVLMRRDLSRRDAPIARLQRAQTRRRGFLPSTLSAMRHMLARHLGGDHRDLADRGLPLLAVWGTDDPVIPVSNVGRLAELNRAARQVTVDEAGHGLPYTHPEDMAAAIGEFLADTGG